MPDTPHDDQPDGGTEREHDQPGERGDPTDGDQDPVADGGSDSSTPGTSDSHDGEIDETSKHDQLDEVRENPEGEELTSDHGVKISDTDNSLKAGERGPTIMEDFHFREKMTQFDHESIPERVVHARGTGAHGYFQPYEDPDLGDEYDDIEEVTKAKVLTDSDQKTPVFTRFSTVVGSRGSSDTVRDVRGFATKFYTEEGNWDLVGNNMPPFFIQDAMEFPDLVHAIKPEPDDGMPQASAAHDTFWDFASLKPEISHMIMWVLSGRALPRAYRMMQGFGVHTFRLVNDDGESVFVKFHWTPELGTHQLVWDETTKLWGKSSDFNRKGLYDVIEEGYDPEWELGIQIFDEEQAEEFDFDVLDPTKIVPETEVPVRPIGKMVLNETPDNFFAEVEQVAFHPGNVVPGIDFSNDPLLQGRLFSYQDTQLNRFGSANWDEIPINRPVAERHNNQRAGFMRQEINEGKASYKPNSIGDDDPQEVPEEEGGYEHYAEKISGKKIRNRSDSFEDHFTQARLFWNSMSEPEKQNIVDAAHFELGKVDRMEIRERMVYDLFNNVDHGFAKRVAEGIGVEPPESPGDELPDHDREDPSLSMENRTPDTIETRKIAMLIDDDFDDEHVSELRSALEDEGARVKIISKVLGEKSGANGETVEPDKHHVAAASVSFDAVLVPGGSESVDAMTQQGDPKHFVAEAFKHYKPIAAVGEGTELFEAVDLPDTDIADDGDLVSDAGVVTCRNDDLDEFAEKFIDAIAQHRHWDRDPEAVPA
ncbi:catalase [Natrialba magadii ATCC 43099]|uniref:Catalase n=1 Tax=Natrialba magadii (strain ATCC 43099 / DSM 3394 / CCM 3739 / CIP 104546 / IAM 13178 / JCM 8861 / NBRC 102185 / NCIMB 2190 / MS3) TaxID=547559 RepID=D3ST74_NATMM|nr:catalase [Natrialba magadii]ADD06941.1 catalase [Natrialba magadii ATCC 43099]ELY28435.1 catalase [Natrialba magadii ATCC 43099]